MEDPADGLVFEGPDGVRYDFSKFHPIDHYPWQPRCRRFYGGWRRHLVIAWMITYRQRCRSFLLKPWYTGVLCRMGRHSQYTGHVSSGRRHGFYVGCDFCDWTRSATEDEWFRFPGDRGGFAP
jgi:hypothetical protein